MKVDIHNINPPPTGRNAVLKSSGTEGENAPSAVDGKLLRNCVTIKKWCEMI